MIHGINARWCLSIVCLPSDYLRTNAAYSAASTYVTAVHVHVTPLCYVVQSFSLRSSSPVCSLPELQNSIDFISLIIIKSEVCLLLTRKLCYSKDDRAMRAI